nr:MAG TPA: hypothetical protein [Caudoviricetes sp.]
MTETSTSTRTGGSASPAIRRAALWRTSRSTGARPSCASMPRDPARTVAPCALWSKTSP